MIEYALLIMLGFCAAGLLALVIAPTIWARAVRLTTKRLDATLPMSLSDIEADKDLLRANYAIQIRRLEASLNKARDKSASQLVEISRLQMVIGEARDQAAALEKQLEERRNAANVFERTITKRFPELEEALAAAKAALDERAYELADLQNKLARKDEAHALSQRSAALQQAEIRKLRQALEHGGADKTGRFKKRPAQWSLEEYRSEYDRLNSELSKMREQLALGHERETSQIAVLRSELQNLAEQIMASVAAQERQSAAQRSAEAAPAARPREAPPSPRKRSLSERTAVTPQPWPSSTERPASLQNPAAPKSPAGSAFARPEPATRQSPSVPASLEPPSRSDDAAGSSRGGDVKRVSTADDGAASAMAPEPSAALKSLLDRAAQAARPDGVFAASVASAGQAHGSAALSTAVAEAAAPELASDKAKPDLDRMLREIFDTRPAKAALQAGEQAGTAAEKTAPEPIAAGKAAPSSPPASPQASEENEESAEGKTDKGQSPRDRIRVV